MFLLLVIAFNGNITTNYYDTAAQCEVALFNATDAGKYKEIEQAKCIDLTD
jgi:hypothetical protein